MKRLFKADVFFGVLVSNLKNIFMVSSPMASMLSGFFVVRMQGKEADASQRKYVCAPQKG